MTTDPCGVPVVELETALVDYYMPVGQTGIQFVAALKATLFSWGPYFSTVDAQAAYRRAGSTLAHMCLVSGDTFEFLRLARGFTQQETADFLKVTLAEIVAWESGASLVSTATWYRLAEEVCRVDGRQFTPYPTLPPTDLRARCIRVFPDVPLPSAVQRPHCSCC